MVNQSEQRNEPHSSYIKFEPLPRPGNHNSPQSHEADNDCSTNKTRLIGQSTLLLVYDNLHAIMYTKTVIEILKPLPKLPQ